MRHYTVTGRLVSVGRDYDVLDEEEQVAFVVDGKVRFARTFIIKDSGGKSLLNAREKLLSLDVSYLIDRDGETIATVRRTGDPTAVSPTFEVDIPGQTQLQASGSFFLDGVAIRRGEDLVGTVTRQPNTVMREVFPISIAEAEDQPLLLAIVMCIIEITPGRGEAPAS